MYCTSEGNFYNIRIPFSGISKYFYFLLYISLYHFFALTLLKGYRNKKACQEERRTDESDIRTIKETRTAEASAALNN